MTNNTDRSNPPSLWDGIEARPVGDDTYWMQDPDDPTQAGILIWHWCEAPNLPAPRWMAAGVIRHTLVSSEPLHLEPSLLWPCCEKHGFIRDGKWTPA